MTTTRERTYSTAIGGSRPDASTRAHRAIVAGGRQQHNHLEDVLHRHLRVPTGHGSRDTPGRAGPAESRRARKVPAAMLLHVGRHRRYPLDRPLGSAGARQPREAPATTLQQGRRHHCHLRHEPLVGPAGGNETHNPPNPDRAQRVQIWACRARPSPPPSLPPTAAPPLHRPPALLQGDPVATPDQTPPSCTSWALAAPRLPCPGGERPPPLPAAKNRADARGSRRRPTASGPARAKPGGARRRRRGGGADGGAGGRAGEERLGRPRGGGDQRREAEEGRGRRGRGARRRPRGSG